MNTLFLQSRTFNWIDKIRHWLGERPKLNFQFDGKPYIFTAQSIHTTQIKVALPDFTFKDLLIQEENDQITIYHKESGFPISTHQIPPGSNLYKTKMTGNYLTLVIEH